MRRILFEWGGIACGAAAIACFGYWAISLLSSAADFQLTPVWEPSTIQVSGADGELLFCDHFANLEVIELVDQSALLEPAVATDFNCPLPGFDLRLITFSGGSSIWSLRLSLLIPAVILASLCGFCFYRFYRLRASSTTNSAAGRAAKRTEAA